MTTRLRNISHYCKYTQEDIDNIKAFIETHIYPATMTTRQKRVFKEKFGEHWIVSAGVLYYNPNPTLKLEVVPPAEHETKMQEIYKDATKGLGLGLNTFYRQITQHYLGISKIETAEFLKKQGDYMLTRPYRKAINKPILSSTPNERWGMDHIDLNQYKGFNNQHRYILTIVDYFSKKFWAVSQTQKSMDKVITDLNALCIRENTYPHVLQADNGFNNTEMKAWCKEHNIKYIPTRSYTPQSAGLIERYNQELRKKIKEGFVRYDSLVWKTHLQDYVSNINNQPHGTTKYTPNQLWKEGYYSVSKDEVVNPYVKPTDQLTTEQKRKLVKSRLYINAKKQVQNHRKNAFHAGDRVRVAVKTFQPEIRKKIKAGESKLISVKYSPYIYKIHHVYPAKAHQRIHYSLIGEGFENEVYNTVLKNNGNILTFYENQLIKVPDGDVPPSISTEDIGRANVLNLIKD